ncbi:MAG: sugar ABC transporter permease [Sulfolobaceae archaeon]|nr:sugar ABC transporter permease [Candidatus Jingweiarchaeum tengchongense]MCW1306130.1 sugar ABC transporter permease [Candidatus Jingweiarchaeum tengchongense]
MFPVKSKKIANLKHNMVAWLYLSPFIVVYATFMVYPLVRGIQLSFFHKTFFSGYNFAGFSNYIGVLTDPVFIQDIFNILYFTVATVLIYTFLSLIIANIFNRKGILTYIMRSFVIAPLVLSVSVIGIIWQLLFTSGPGNNLISFIIGKNVQVLNNPSFAMWLIIMATLWWTLGSNVIIFLAGLQSIPSEYYEAAKLDGASDVRTFFSITLPLLRPLIIVVIILQTIASFQLFGQPYTITGGGPFNTTATPLMYIYGYLTTNIGFASAASVILFLMMLAVSFIELFVISRRKEEW